MDKMQEQAERMQKASRDRVVPPVEIQPFTVENVRLHTSGGSTLHPSSDYGDYRKETVDRLFEDIGSEFGASERYDSESGSVTSQEDLLETRSDFGDHRKTILQQRHSDLLERQMMEEALREERQKLHRSAPIHSSHDREVHGSQPLPVVHTDRSPLLGTRRQQETSDWGIFEWLHQILTCCGLFGGFCDSALED